MPMIHPLLHTLATKPALFVEHASGYAELAVCEARAAAQSWQRRGVLLAAAVLLTLLALIFTGIAVLLAGALPVAQMPLPLLLLALPLLFWGSAAVCAWAGWREPRARAFDHLRQQVQADMQLLRDADAAS
jgi:uncharacterized membrane protein YqjE